MKVEAAVTYTALKQYRLIVEGVFSLTVFKTEH